MPRNLSSRIHRIERQTADAPGPSLSDLRADLRANYTTAEIRAMYDALTAAPDDRIPDDRTPAELYRAYSDLIRVQA